MWLLLASPIVPSFSYISSIRSLSLHSCCRFRRLLHLPPSPAAPLPLPVAAPEGFGGGGTEDEAELPQPVVPTILASAAAVKDKIWPSLALNVFLEQVWRNTLRRMAENVIVRSPIMDTGYTEDYPTTFTTYLGCS